MQNVKIINSNIVTAFDDLTIGTKVVDAEQFMAHASAAIASTDFTGQKVSGQAFIMCKDIVPFVSAGVGARTQDPNDYVARLYRGNVELFLKREKAAKVEGAALVVYTREAYLADPDVMKDADKRAHVEESDCTHVLVAILGFAGPKAPLSPYRLVHNLAGGNNEAATWSTDDIRTKAAESKAYHDEWCTVAD